MSTRKQKAAGIIGTVVITISVCGVGYAVYTMTGGSEDDVNVSVVVPEVIDEAAEAGSISITNISSTSNVFFDGTSEDTSGVVQSDKTDDTQSGFDVTGTLKGYSFEDFVSINPVLQVDSAYREDYDYLKDNNYIGEPTFTNLGVTTSYSTDTIDNSFYWTSSSSSSNRTFRLRYTYSYGAFFNYMNPSEFFDSTTSNSTKKGSEYTTSEIREILSKFTVMEGATYTLYLDVQTTSNTYTATLDAGSGYFSTTDTTATTYTYSNLTYHSRIELLTPYRENYIFNYWEYSSSTLTGYVYLNELISSSTTSKTVTLTANYTSDASTLTVTFSGSNSDASFVFDVQSSDGTTSNTCSYSSSSTTYSLKIGDVITIRSKTGVSTITAGGGLTAVNVGIYKVTSSACTFTVETVPMYALSWSLSASTNLTYIAFNVGDSLVTYDGSFSSSSAKYAEGTTLSLSNIRGVDHFEDSSGNTITEITIGSSDTSISVVPATSVYLLTVAFTADANYDDGADSSITVGVVIGDSTYTLGSASDLSSSSSSAATGYFVSGETYSIGYTYMQSATGGVTGSSSTTTLTVDSSHSGTLSGTMTSNYTITFTGYNESSGGCILPDTLVNMADGTYKRAEDVKVGDEVLIFNHVTGKFDTGIISMNVHDGEDEGEFEVYALHFSNGKVIEVVAEHGFFDVDLNEYVYIGSNCRQFVGHRFYAIKGNGDLTPQIVTLDSVDVYMKKTKIYSPVTFKHLDVVTEDILSLTGILVGLFNYFELDENMKVDQEKMQRDIEKYGTFDYSVWEPYLTELEYEAFNAKYMTVSIGKGMVTFERLVGYIMTFLRK